LSGRDSPRIVVFGGVLERFALTLCLAHAGGCVPALRGRVDLGWRSKAVAHTVPLPPTAYLDRLYYDTAAFSPVVLRRLVDDVGAGHVLLGTDHPFELRDPWPLRTVRALGLAPAQERAILWDTAASRLGLARPAQAERRAPGAG
jgi:aminocarboxymuconate-semialdehyde decarboxylase